MRSFLEKLRDFPRNGDGGGGGGGGDGQQQQTPPAWTPPANAPAHLVDADPGKAYEKLLGAYEPLRVKLDSVPRAPDRPEAYALSLEGALSGYGETLKNDPIMPEARKLAHGVGMSQDQFQKFVGGFINIMHDKGAFAPMPTDAKIAEGLIDAALQGNARAEAITVGTKRLTDARAWVDGLKDSKDFSAHEKAELGMMVNSPGGVGLIERFMKQAGQETVNPGGQADPAGNLVAEYEKRLQDPRNRTEPAFAEETRAMSKRVFQRR